jgi:hypothetical protein
MEIPQGFSPQHRSMLFYPRHCERSEAIHFFGDEEERWIASLRSQ